MRGRGGGRGGPRGRLEAGSGDSEPAAPCETPGVLLRACSGALRALRGCHRSAHTPGGLRGWQRGRAAPLGACCLAGAATKLGSPPPGGSRGSFLHLVALKLFSQIGSYPIAFSPPARSSLFRSEGLPREVPLPGKDSLLCQDPRPAPPCPALGADSCLGGLPSWSSTGPGTAKCSVSLLTWALSALRGQEVAVGLEPPVEPKRCLKRAQPLPLCCLCSQGPSWAAAR